MLNEGGGGPDSSEVQLAPDLQFPVGVCSIPVPKV